VQAAEANAWLAGRGSERRVESSTTIAELHAMLADEAAAAVALPPEKKLGFM
jgi:hypothetical protein